MSIENVFKSLPAEFLNCIFVKSHLVCQEHLPTVFRASEISFGIALLLVQEISLSVTRHIHSADVISGFIELGDHLFVARNVFGHSVAYLDNAFYLGSR